MDKVIEMIGSDFGWQNIAILFCLIVTGLPSFLKGWDYLCDRFHFETKGSRERKEQNQKCAVQAAAIKALEDKIAEYDSTNREHWQTSIEYRNKYADDQSAIMNQLSSIAESVNALQKKMDENELRKRIDSLRSTIISFATSLGNPQFRPSLDHYNSIFTKVREYEDVLEQNGLENGQTNISVKIIEKHYSDAVERGDFLKIEE